MQYIGAAKHILSRGEVLLVGHSSPACKEATGGGCWVIRAWEEGEGNRVARIREWAVEDHNALLQYVKGFPQCLTEIVRLRDALKEIAAADEPKAAEKARTTLSPAA